MTLIKNILNSARKLPICQCNSWIGHWEKNTDKRAVKCSNKDCNANTDLIGALVQKIGNTEEWIVPLCKDCNHHSNTASMDVENIELVSTRNCF